jgi:hypothetical protein
MAASTTSISNMNIITLIKEIFQTLKNLDARYYSLEETVKSSMGGMETKLAVMEAKMVELAQMQLQLLEMNKPAAPVINPNLERELQDHLKSLDGGQPYKLALNLSEMTIANLLDNDYTVDDVNKNLQSSDKKVDQLLF